MANVGAPSAEQSRPVGRSRVYEQYPPPFDPRRNGFDFHGELYLDYTELIPPTCPDLHVIPYLVYYMPTNESEVKFARQLYENIKKEFPEVRFDRL